LAEGIVEGKALLQVTYSTCSINCPVLIGDPLISQDWIIIAMTHYNEELFSAMKKQARAKGETVGEVSIDVTFSKAENMAILPKCVLGLLKVRKSRSFVLFPLC